MKSTLILLFLCLGCLGQDTEEDNGIFYNNTDPDIHHTFQEIVEENDFLFEEHEVETEDGYLLTVFRIPGKVKEFVPHPRKEPVLLWHGILDSADCWIMHRPHWAPAFILVREGYDVWLPNSRGNKYSKKHTSLDVESREYWSFGFEHMGTYDVPAVIDYVKKKTRRDQVAYIGHSQGTSQMFYALSENEDYFKENLAAFIALGPVLNLTNCGSELIQYVAKYADTINWVFNLFGIYEIFPADWWLSEEFGQVCSLLPELCNLGLSLISDDHPYVNSLERTPVYMGHYPSGSSLRGLMHFGQILNAQQFQRYDFGEVRNMEEYKRKQAPLIDVTKISSIPIAMFVGRYDLLADATDNEATAPLLKTLAFYKEYDIGHLGFLLARDMSYFREDVVDVLQQLFPSKNAGTE